MPYLRGVELKYKITEVESQFLGQGAVFADQVAELFKDLRNETKEKFIAISIDSSGKIISFEVVAIGSLNSIAMRPMEVFRTAIVLNAHALILVHNHPSGDPAPSQDDRVFTQKCVRVADDLGLKLWDHVIIGLDSYYSFARQAELSPK